MLTTVACLSALHPRLALAQWIVTNLHPAGATESQALAVGPGVGGVKQVGYATIGGAPHASLWSGAASSWVDLHPAAATPAVSLSVAYGISGTQQVGAAYYGSTSFASVWTGSAASWQNINPSASSAAYGVHNGRIVGFAVASQTSTSAVEWIGAMGTYLSGGHAYGVEGASRVGAVRIGSFPLYRNAAVLFTGNPPLYIDLHPAGARLSSAAAVAGGQQVGQATLEPALATHASLWTGSAASWVDLHPAGAVRSECSGVSAGKQVGSANVIEPADPVNGIPRASLWTGTAASWVNLNAFLPPNFTNSYAKGIWSDATTTYVVGYGFNSTTNRTEALMWTRANCGSCPADFNCSGGPPTVADIFAFLTAWFAQAPAADFNGAGGVTVADIFAFLTAWFAGCP